MPIEETLEDSPQVRRGRRRATRENRAGGRARARCCRRCLLRLRGAPPSPPPPPRQPRLPRAAPREAEARRVVRGPCGGARPGRRRRLLWGLAVADAPIPFYLTDRYVFIVRACEDKSPAWDLRGKRKRGQNPVVSFIAFRGSARKGRKWLFFPREVLKGCAWGGIAELAMGAGAGIRPPRLPKVPGGCHSSRARRVTEGVFGSATAALLAEDVGLKLIKIKALRFVRWGCCWCACFKTVLKNVNI